MKEYLNPIEIYNSLIVDKPELACKVSLKDIQRAMKELKKEGKFDFNQNAKGLSCTSKTA